MKFYPKKKVILVSLVLMAIFLRLSYWQWTRHQEKLGIIASLEQRLRSGVIPFSQISSSELPNYNFKRVLISGTYDFDHEVVLRNRRYQGDPGTFVLTPLHTSEGQTILVNRGFVPLSLSNRESRKTISRPQSFSFVGLIKESQPKKFLAPSDPPAGKDLPWVDEWLRPDIESIQKQLPYAIAPVFLEIVGTDASEDIEKKIIQQHSDKADLFMPSEHMYSMVGEDKTKDSTIYPIPVFDVVIPPARHLGYVFEWAAMALITLLICILLQLRPSASWTVSAGIFVCCFLPMLGGCSLSGGRGNLFKEPTLVHASYYGGTDSFQGKKTASGETFDFTDLTAAHKNLPFGTILRLKNPENERVCLVRITDRGPYVSGRELDISRQAAFELGMLKKGTTDLWVQRTSLK